jgi:hypothetical protein
VWKKVFYKQTIGINKSQVPLINFTAARILKTEERDLPNSAEAEEH